MNEKIDTKRGRTRLMVSMIAMVATAGMWIFPSLWYVGGASGDGGHWVAERSEIDDWTFHETEVSETAERILVADSIFSGEFRNESKGKTIRVFSAKRESDSGRDIGLFVHTPDRCWTESGWIIEPAEPSFVSIDVNGIEVGFERRIFSNRGRRELVYFCGLVNGNQLPYRLDHNLDVGLQAGKMERTKGVGSSLRMIDRKFWTGIGNSFLSREFLWGPKQFVRVSTPCSGLKNDSDDLLIAFIQDWLEFQPLEES